ncbi:MAG: hypothetical protein JO340_07740 [Acidobacteriaceae bacterium]|nr:hypothetical protein [Acidobacteriaceae bacterium]
MNAKLVEEIANAVLYEGYILYPYRASAVKNRQRWNFGVLYPRAYAEAQTGADAWSMQTECLVRTTAAHSTLNVRARFLHLIERSSKMSPSWQEAAERDVVLESLDLRELTSRRRLHAFYFPASRQFDGDIVRTSEPAEGAVEVQAQELAPGTFKLRVRVFNAAIANPALGRDAALLRSLASTHAILNVEGGEFISMTDPPDQLREAIAQCSNIGAWPVLAGDAGARDAMLSSPIILYDYPRIASESAGALFDGTEIDEILTLRIMTLTDEEKREMDEVDSRAREILRRTECMPPEQLMKMHGALRGLRPVAEGQIAQQARDTS